MESADLRRPRSGPVAGLALAAAAASGLLLAAVGPARAQDAKPAAPIPDPWEHINRGFYRFSMSVDRAVIAPVVHGYMAVMPEPVRTGVRNAVYNLDEPRTFANDVLQGRFERAGRTTIRFAVNSTVGLAGFVDVAGKTGLPGHDADFGQTLGRYGVGTGPYIFVPFAGPSDVRDGLGRIVDAVGDPVAWALGGLTTTFGEVRDGVRVTQARVDMDEQIRGLDRDFTDPYATLRSGYSQNRAFKIQEARGVSAAAAVNNLPDFGGETAPGPSPTPGAKP